MHHMESIENQGIPSHARLNTVHSGLVVDVKGVL